MPTLSADTRELAAAPVSTNRTQLVAPRASTGGAWASWPGAILLFLLIAAAHAVGTVTVYQFNHLTSAGEVVFPAAGVTIAALLLLPRARWWVVLLATVASEFVADRILGEVVPTAAGSALANTVEPLVGALLVLWLLRDRIDLSRQRDLLTFVLVGGVAALCGAFVGAVSTRFTPGHSPFWSVFARWETGDGLGILIVGALTLAWLNPSRSVRRPRYAVVEMAVLAVGCAVITYAAFWNWSPALAYLTLVPLGWAAVRFGVRGATAAAALIAVISEWATNSDHGLFAVVSDNHTNALWFLQLFLGVAILGGLVIAASVAEVTRKETALRLSESAERDAHLAAVEAQTAERSRLARELHDSISQTLFSMTMHVRAAQLAMGTTTDNSRAVAAIEQLRTLTSGAFAEIRALIFELRPGALADEGLLSALRRQATAISAREGVHMRMDTPDRLPALTSEVEEHCYRIILEAWHNTAKHAHAKTITTTIKADDHGISLQTTDDGRGFDLAAERPGHLGLQTMRERASAIGATLNVISRPGKGTTVRIYLPRSAAIPGVPVDDGKDAST